MCQYIYVMIHNMVRNEQQSHHLCDDSEWEMCQYFNTKAHQYLMCRYISVMTQDVMMNEQYYSKAMNQGTFKVSENYVSFITSVPIQGEILRLSDTIILISKKAVHTRPEMKVSIFPSI